MRYFIEDIVKFESGSIPVMTVGAVLPNMTDYQARSGIYVFI